MGAALAAARQASSMSLSASASLADAPGAPGRPNLNQREIYAILGGVILAMFLAALDQTIVATALATIGRDLGDPDLLPWVVSIYLLAATTVTPLYGKASDIWGRRPLMMTAIAVFLAGSVACALAPDMISLIVARGVQGLGGGGLISLAQTVLADVLTPRERSRYQIHIASVFATSSLLGPALGGFLSGHLHWSAIFWINLPLGGVALWLCARLLKRLPRHERRHRLDFAGALLLMGATISLLLAMGWGGRRYPWFSWPIAATVGLSLVLWVLFALHVRRTREPLIPLDILRNRVVVRACVASCFGMGVFIGLSIYAPLYFEIARSFSTADAGLAVTPMMVATVFGATASGRSMMYFNRYKGVALTGLAMSFLGLTALAVLPLETRPAWITIALLATTSAGIGSLFPVCTISIQNAVALHQLGTATAAMNFFRQMGAALIVAAFGAIMLNGAAFAGHAAGFSGEGVRIAGALTPDAAHGLAMVFRWIFGAAALGVLIAAGALASMEERPLRSA